MKMQFHTTFGLFLQSFLLARSLALAAEPNDNSRRASSACAKLAAQYPSLTFMPGTAEYELQIANAWSPTCVFPALCVFEPECAQDVAGALAILRQTNTQFSVRGGGHLAKPGATGITNGVQISLNRITTMAMAENNTVAQLGPGLRWVTVYNWTSSFGLGIPGGRFGDVGVPGLLLGGGISWFGSELGWSMSSVRNYEVVLADGRIVDANATGRYSDLWWALKGGSSNFGIVTRFDCATFPVTDMFGGAKQYAYTPANYDAYIDAVASYIEPTGGSSDARSSLDPLTVVSPESGQVVVVGAYLSRRGGDDPDPACFANFSMPAATILDTTRVSPSLIDFQAEGDAAMYSDHTHRELIWVTGLRARAASVYLANATFFEWWPRLASVPNLTTSITYQPISQAWLQQARRAGGDAIDLDPADGGLIALQFATAWLDAQYDAVAAEWSRNVTADLDARARAAGLSYPFVYINDAGFTEKVFSNYGGGKSLPKMKAIAKKYDPSGVFQTLMPGGFKIFDE
ncbi:FAD-binding domain-containing protein [Diplogelasinospora grovesii]|uniref:FAD-binding domain-containing protein n=1 Tax=Diplogelasinospora grovesii TaxID=303347 RepID=A0AAN6S9Q6_9PEZI|nr:FAD-binding domain-containing protein [Diplogelasinospora grovesii]